MRTLADLAGPLAAMHAIAAEYPLLPAAEMQVVPIAPNQLMVACHDSIATFEAWREALHADPDSVEMETTQLGRLHLVAEAVFGGVTVIIHGYTSQVRTQAMQAVA